MKTMVNPERFVSERARAVKASGIRRVFELGTTLRDPINLSIGQPDFPVPEPIKQAAIRAIENDRNGYTLTQGVPELVRSISRHLQQDVGWSVPSEELEVIVTSGTSGAVLLLLLAALNPGDEVILADPYFVMYPAVAHMSGVSVRYCDTYPDFRLTAGRIESAVSDHTKLLVLNSPNNPSGVVVSSSELEEIVHLCSRRGILIVSDEIYDQFTYPDARENGKCPSPARLTDHMILVRGFGKSYGCTGWRMGYAAGPKPIITQMQKLQQFTFVCAPSIAQVGLINAFAVDISHHVRAYQRKRDMVISAFRGVTSVVHPGGAFYAFVEVPPQLGLTATQFAEEATKRNVLIIPGNVFSRRDTHFRISYAVADEKLSAGLDVLCELMS